jgi:RNA polymerase sigma factor (sigma-70 family)
MRADQDTVLARRAAAGDGAAFALLYDRHERRAYNLCYRITGSADDAADATQETFLKVLERLPGLADRELNFGSYLLTAARHASYDAIERRKRALPSAEIPDSVIPRAAAADEPALLAAHQEQIRAANELLPPRQREVLALRELDELSYDEVAEIMGMNRNAVAQLISRARLNLRDALRRGALGAIPAGSPDCEAALPLLALAQDNGLDDAARADWLAEHLAGCATCRVRVEAMEEAGTAYRLWLPLVPALWLRAKTAEAAERTSAAADGRDVTDAGARASFPRHGRRILAAAVAGAVLLVGVTAQIVHAPVHEPRAAVVAATATPTATPTAAPRVVKDKPKPKARPKPKPKPKAKPQPVVIAAAPTPAPPPPTPVAAAPRSKPKPKARIKPAEVAELPPPVVTPDPTPEPVAEPEPSPEPPQPDPPPPPPRRPVICTTCGITAPPPVP